MISEILTFEQAAIIRQMYDWYINGLGMTAIAQAHHIRVRCEVRF